MARPNTNWNSISLIFRPAAFLLALAVVAGGNLSAQDHVRFAVIGDYGLAGQPEADVAALVRGWNPDIIITTGDNNYPDGAASTIDANIGQYYHEFIHPYLGAYGQGADTNRFFPSMGNHDWLTTGGMPYLDYFTLPGNERYYDFTWGPVHFFAIDSDPSEPDGITSTSLQGTWLRDRLAASTSRWKIVYMHHAPYSSGTTHGSTEVMQWPYHEWGATTVLAGHEHAYERILIDLFPYFVNGIGGADRYGFGTPLQGSKVRYTADYGAMLVDANADSIVFRCYSRTGMLVDSYTFNPPSTPSVLVEPDTLRFVAEVGGISDTSAVSIYNAGLDTLVITDMQIGSNNFHVVGPTAFPLRLPEYGDHVTVRVAFAAPTDDEVQDTLKITTNDPIHPQRSIVLLGRGLVIRNAAKGVLYATGLGGSGELYTLNTASGEATVIGQLGVPEIHSMAIRPVDGKIYGIGASEGSTWLYKIDSQSGMAVRSVAIPLGNLRAIAFSKGDTLFGATAKGSLYRIDHTTGHPDSVGTAPGLVYAGLVFSPSRQQLWASVRFPIDSIFTLERSTGAATFVGVTGFYAWTSSIAFDSAGTLYALIDNGSGEDYLATIDTTTAAGTIIAGPLVVRNLRAITIRIDQLSTGASPERNVEVPDKFELAQNYPNPFNPTTKIQFTIANRQLTILKVFDVLGREASTLVNEVKEPGTYTVEFDASGLASGVYLCRLIAGDFVTTRKVMLMR